MRTLTILPAFLFATAALVGVALAEDKTCKTRKPAIEARFDQLCPLVRKVHPRPTPWNETKCATWLFERGVSDFRERTQITLLNAATKQTRRELRAERQAEFGDPTPLPTASPTPSPTVAPTATPAP